MKKKETVRGLRGPTNARKVSAGLVRHSSSDANIDEPTRAQATGRNGEIIPLTAIEKTELARCEQVFSDRTRPFYEWGRALATIQKARLFRESCQKFEEYCRQRWRISRIQVYRLIKAADIMYAVVLPMGNISLPTHERQVRPLARVDRRLVPEIWRQAVKDGGDNHVTASHVIAAIGKLALNPDKNRPMSSNNKVVGTTSQNRQPSRVVQRKLRTALAQIDVHVTERQGEVLELMKRGLSAKEIAGAIGNSVHTIRNHQRGIYEKLRVHSHGQAVFKAFFQNRTFQEQ